MTEIRLPTRHLGSLETTGLGMGVMNVVHAYGPPIERREAVRLVRHAFDRGVRFFDPAEVYGPFTAEEIAGEAFAGVRDQVRGDRAFFMDVLVDDESKAGPAPAANRVEQMVEGVFAPGGVRLDDGDDADRRQPIVRIVDHCSFPNR